MNEQEKKIRLFRLTIIVVSVVGLLSSLPLLTTMFAYGVGDNNSMFLYFPSLIVLGIAIILNFFKRKFGYYLTIISATIGSILLINDVGFFLIFNLQNSVLLLVLLLPFFSFLTLIPLTTIYLTQNLRQKKIIQISSIIFAVGIFIFAIADRYNKNYFDNIFIDAEISKQGQIILNCKPGFGDSRTFIVRTNLKEIGEQIKKYGEFYQGSYFLQNTKIKNNFRFSKLKSITLTKIGDNIISPQLTWTTSEIKGNVDFLQP